MAEQSRQIVWVDAGGRTRVTIPMANPDSSGIMAALEAKSNAGVLSWFEGPPTFLSPTPVSAIYPDISDLARLTFTDGTDMVVVALPAPIAAIFRADGVTVDPTQIAAIIAACVGTLTTSSGSLVTAYVAGTRNQRSSGS